MEDKLEGINSRLAKLEETVYNRNLESDIDVTIEDPIADTLDELYLLWWIILTFGLIYFVGSKRRDTSRSYIHSFFKYIDFFPPAMKDRHKSN